LLNGERPARSGVVKSIAYPGSRFNYSGGGTLIVRKIIEDLTGEDYASVVTREVLKPLQMSHSSYALHPHHPVMPFARGHLSDGTMVSGGYTVNPELAPDGLWTTPTDLAKFVISLQQILAADTSRFLSKSLLMELLTPVDSSIHASGFFVLKKGGNTWFQHSGANVGYRSNFYGSFEGGRGVVVMTNSDQYDIIPEIINSVAYCYGWKDFYQPELRALVNVPDDVRKKQAGVYAMDSPAVLRFAIRENNGHLELSSDGVTYERMYHTDANGFFLLSSKQLDWRFETNPVSGKFDLLIRQGNEVFRAIAQ